MHHPGSQSTELTGLGVGLLSATAVALSSKPTDLPVFGAEAVRIAFRMGIHVFQVSQQLETRDLNEAPGTWAYVVHNVEPEKAEAELDAIHQSGPASSTGKIFISAVSRTSVTVSGPPSRLRGLFQKSKMFRDATSIALPVYGGLCHAPHIYGPRDLAAIVHDAKATSSAQLDDNHIAILPLHSTSTGMSYEASSGAELFDCVVKELLTSAIQWDNVIDNIVEVARRQELSKIAINCFGNSIPLRDLEKALQDGVTGLETMTNSYMAAFMEKAPTDANPRGTAQAKLAIVGMSCRLPGGATDTEKFWEILENGLDVSRRIPADRFDIGTKYLL